MRATFFLFPGEEQNWKPVLLFQMLKYYFNLNLSPLTCEILKTDCDLFIFTSLSFILIHDNMVGIQYMFLNEQMK